ncbi:hypothetical protein [Streptomyces aidingensis]|uniref:Uncharacterized protein n=1 Tax=Streptomyces aidingensis TaxID=910347 RepID=A0A1I1EN17_9ACTN|nr:hypothetical protein [Streptomyces aidingensis]SFB88056.1 hypothetical protein SAMN05421773_101366 [Streptomyces aidingensis]
MSELVPLAARELNEYTVTPGVLGFIVFAVMGVAVWLLLKSMTRQLNKIDFKERDREEH